MRRVTEEVTRLGTARPPATLVCRALPAAPHTATPAPIAHPVHRIPPTPSPTNYRDRLAHTAAVPTNSRERPTERLAVMCWYLILTDSCQLACRTAALCNCGVLDFGQFPRDRFSTEQNVRSCGLCCGSVSAASGWYCTGCTIKKQSFRKKILYFNNGSMDLSQTFRLCMRILTQHILQILLKQLLWLNRYSSLNFKVHCFKGTCSCALNIFTNNK